MFSASLFSASTGQVDDPGLDINIKPENYSVKIGDLTYTLTEFSLKGGKFRKLLKVTKEYSQIMNTRAGDLSKASHISMKMKITGGGDVMGGTATFHTKSGKVTLSGGYINCNQNNDFKGLNSQPRNLLKAFFKIIGDESYIDNPLKVSNVTLNGRIPYELKGIRSIPGYKYDVAIAELETARRVTYTLPSGVGVRISYTPRNKQINLALQSGMKTKGDVQTALRETKELIKKMEAVRMIKKVSGNAAPVPKKGRLARRAEGNVAAPNVTRRGTTCPPSKRPVPHSFEGKCPPGYYVRPNPQGNPCCYKIPKNLKYMATKIKGYYSAAGVKVPASVKALFPDVNFGNANRAANRNRGEADITIQNMKARMRAPNGKMEVVNTIRIGSRQCERYTKQQLVDIVTRMKRRANVRVGAPGGLDFHRMSKPQLCEFIKMYHKGTSANQSTNKYTSGFMINGKFKELRANGKIGRRVASTYSKTDLARFASKLRIPLNATATKVQLLKAIENKRLSMNAAMKQKRQNNINAAAARRANAARKAREAAARNISLKRRAEEAKEARKAKEAEERARVRSLKRKQKEADQARRAEKRAQNKMMRELDRRMAEARAIFRTRAIKANKVVNMNAFNSAIRSDPKLIKANDYRPGVAWKRERFLPWLKKYVANLNTNNSSNLNSFAASLERNLMNNNSNLNNFAASLERSLEKQNK